jgi:hypothetical protein
MKYRTTRANRLAFALVRLAANLLPRGRSDWGRAMMAEVHHIESERDAIFWAFGCLGASGKTRISTWISMNRRMEMRGKVIRSLVGIMALALVSTAGVYAVQKPYQKDRIAIWLHLKSAQDLPAVNNHKV